MRVGNQSAWYSPQPRLREANGPSLCYQWIQISVLIIVYCTVVGKFENLKFSKLPFMRTCHRKDEKTAPKGTRSFVAVRPIVRPCLFLRIQLPKMHCLFFHATSPLFSLATYIMCDTDWSIVDRKDTSFSLPSLPASAS